MKAILRAALCAIILAASTSCSFGQGLFNLITVSTDYYPDRGEAPYDFRVTLLGSNEQATLTAPDGTLFEQLPGKLSLSHTITGLTQTDLSRFVGEWSIDDSLGLPSGASPQKHIFNVSVSDMLASPVTPHIVSPEDGAVVPLLFTIKTSHGGVSVSGAGVWLEPRVDPTAGGHTFAVSLLPGFTEGTVVARASNQDNTQRSAVAPGGANRRFTVWTIRDTYSPPSTWTVTVPEPATAVMAFGGFVALAGLRRRN